MTRRNIVIYIAGPFRATNQWDQELNIRRAEALALHVWERGFTALYPHLNTKHYQHYLEDNVWLAGDLELLSRCDAVLLTERWEESEGARSEKVFAEDQGIPVFQTINQLEIWANENSNYFADSEVEVAGYGI